MKQFIITAKADLDRRLPTQRTMVEACDYDEASKKARQLFDEYKEIQINEVTKVGQTE